MSQISADELYNELVELFGEEALEGFGHWDKGDPSEGGGHFVEVKYELLSEEEMELLEECIPVGWWQEYTEEHTVLIKS